MDNKLKIINFLGKHIEMGFTLLELSKQTKIPYATLHDAIQKMRPFLVIRSVGKSKVVILDKKSPVVKSYLSISSEEEKREFLKKQPIIGNIAQELETSDIVVLFGSYAKGKEKASSDIDLLVINKKGERSLSFSKYEILFKKKINPIFLARKEFATMLKESEENVGKQALKDHIILNNAEEFWECVLHG